VPICSTFAVEEDGTYGKVRLQRQHLPHVAKSLQNRLSSDMRQTTYGKVLGSYGNAFGILETSIHHALRLLYGAL
jgi:hypothetical protein